MGIRPEGIHIARLIPDGFSKLAVPSITPCFVACVVIGYQIQRRTSRRHRTLRRAASVVAGNAVHLADNMFVEPSDNDLILQEPGASEEHHVRRVTEYLKGMGGKSTQRSLKTIFGKVIITDAFLRAHFDVDDGVTDLSKVVHLRPSEEDRLKDVFVRLCRC